LSTLSVSGAAPLGHPDILAKKKLSLIQDAEAFISFFPLETISSVMIHILSHRRTNEELHRPQ
jgi:hypothetical protein